MMAAPIKINPKRHELVELDVTHAIRERLSEPRMVTIRHLETGKFSVGIWRDERKGLVQELPLEFRHQSQVSRRDIEDLLFMGSMFHVRRAKQHAKDLALQGYREAKERMEEEREKTERRESFRRTNERKFGAIKAEKLHRWYQWNNV